jgi:integrase
VQKYCYAVRKYFSFCCLLDIDMILPLESISVAKYLAYLRHSGCSQSAVKTAVVALKWLHSFIPGVNKFNCSLSDEFISRLADSAVRNIPKKSNQKQPLSGDSITKIIEKLSSNARLVDIRNVLMPSLAYALLLRSDELCHINCKFMADTAGGIKITIPSSKTDVYREGKVVFLARQQSSTSVCLLLESFMEKAGLSIGMNHFLFTPICRGKVVNAKLSYSTYLTVVKSQVSGLGLDPALYGTHSLRSGGASSLATQVTEFELLLSGRWRDPRSLRSYVKVSDQRRFKISQNLFLNQASGAKVRCNNFSTNAEEEV